MELEDIVCEFCMQTFNRNDNLIRHLNNRPESCIERERLINERVAQKTQVLEQKIKEHETRFEKTVDELIHSNPGIRNRKKVVDDLEAQKKIPNFETIITTAEISIEQLRIALKLGAEGDLLLFKKIILDPYTQKTRCIKIRDEARDKYQIFDGKEWVTVKLGYIVEKIMDQCRERYIPVIKEKHAKLDEIDSKIPPWKYPKKNMKAYDAINDQYIDESKHYGELNAIDTELALQIKNGIQNLLKS
jgi:hypothetical protein